MKKFIALFLALVLCIGLVACGDSGTEQTTNSPAPVEPSPVPSETTTPDPAPEQPSAEPVNAAANAIAYIKNVYKKAAEITGKDFQRIGVVPVGAEKVTVVWTVDVAEDLVKIVVGEDGMVTVDVNENATAETPYVLTATVTGADGTTESLSWNHILPAAMNVDGLTYAEIVDLAYALEDQISTEDAYRLFGTVTSIDTPWSEDYQNITVTIVVAGKEEQPIQCYRLKGEGAKDLKVGDQITVEGILKNYKGTYEFDAGCQLIGFGDHPDQKALLKAAYALGEGASMDYPAVITGVITEIPTPWSDEYGNITVNMEFDGQILQAYRLSGEGAKDLKVGDTITVAGIIKNYKGLVEFDKGCKLVPNDMYHSVKNALSGYKLLDGEAQEAAKTITGTISAIDTPWSEDYQNITVTIIVAGVDSYPIMCYRLKGEGASTLAVGDVITVTGTLKNYKGTIEFDAGCTLDALGATPPAEPIEPSVDPVDPPVDEPTEEPEPEVNNDPAADSTLSIADAYALGASKAHNTYTDGKYYVTGVITEVYNTQYGNMYIADENGNVLTVYGTYDADGTNRYDAMATQPVAGDTVTVYGIIGQYNDKPQMKNGWITAHTPAVGSDEPTEEPEPEVNNDPAADSTLSIADAYALGASKAHNTYTDGKYYVTGVITEVYNTQYGNMYIADENGNTLTVYGTYDADGTNRYDAMATQPVAGDTVTVYGIIGQYNDKPQMKNAWITAHTPAAGSDEPADEPVEEPVVAPTEPTEIVDAAYALESGASLPYSCTLVGTIVTIDTPYSEKYGNITVSIAVAGKEDKPIMCFRLKGDGAADLAVGDEITVTGTIKNYNGTVEFDSGCTLDAVVKGAAMPELVEAYEIYVGSYNSEYGSIIMYPDGGLDFTLAEGNYLSWCKSDRENRLSFAGESTDASGAVVTQKAVFGYSADGLVFLADESIGLSIPNGTLFVYEGWEGGTTEE